MSSTFYCEKCDDFCHFAKEKSCDEPGASGQTDLICHHCETLLQTVMTYQDCRSFDLACKWFIDHLNGQDAGQPLEVVKLIYLSYINFLDWPNSQLAEKYSKEASEKWVNNLTSQQADQHLKNVIKWALSRFISDSQRGRTYMIEYDDPPLFPKTTLEIRACLHLIGSDEELALIKSYLLTSLIS